VPPRFALARPLLLALILVLVSACGGSGDNKVPPTATGGASTTISEPTTSGTLAANEVTAGQIADLIASAWPTVERYVSVTIILPVSGTPAASPEVELTGRAERDVILPNTKRIAITDQGATTEIVLVDGVLSKRATPPGGKPGPWSTVDPAKIDASDPFSPTYNTILAPETPPYSGLSDRQRQRIGTVQGQSTLNGRTCTDYLFPEVSDTGLMFKVVISLDSANLPCRIATTTGQSLSQTDYVFNTAVSIATPAP